MFDSPLQSAANSTTSTATIGGKVVAAFSAAASFFIDDSVLFVAAAAAAAGCCKAAWSCKAATKAAVAAQPRCGLLRAAQATRPPVSGCDTGASRLVSRASSASAAVQKVTGRRRLFFSTAPTHEARVYATG